MTYADHTGTGDPRRTIELLWGVRDKPRRGPKPKLTVEEIVTAAIELADTEGIAALSVRRGAERLGVSPMSLYTYIPSRAELLDLMMDRVHGELTDPPPSHDWRVTMTILAEDAWEMYHRHPWMLQLTTSRLPLGPHTFAKHERELSALDAIGLTDLEMDAVVAMVNGFVQGIARGSVESASLVRRSGMTDLEWWTASAPVLAEIPEADAGLFPLAARVGQAAGEAHGSASAPLHTFRFGLARILDGVEQLLSGDSDA
ncbi:TetR/AcrR family transcriptional regulator [Amycolatopsis regifaucium]|uniref:TetR family transcriptional regulator n=1 Tax=Amycolatopsis regifaucium TaxID=546365 RepID=A0A154MSV3_9PSEU|nr:TetR/AcrR family transcriptional regulator [Amycolatopsis regifaucium]KZB86569.1 TetR family transcriptional regulator [Amycolatopsis regifaucium]OKA03514.1 TetR family transcriptional regulator [Amycolatopsis regifaucium]SFJ16126.1 DNA-binding transcriptional regulator, AcrR family [Amycolatopsis regifaucium]